MLGAGSRVRFGDRSRFNARRVAVLVVGALAAVAAVYVGAAVVGGLLPRNPGWRPPDAGVELYVRTNGVHSELVLPARAAGIDWYVLLPPAHVRDPGSAGGWVAVGWGQREFYLETRTWADLDVMTALRAILGGEALIHVEHLSRPRASEAQRPLCVRPHEYRRIAAFIAERLQRDAGGRPIPLRGSGYAERDVFYEAEGRYHPFRTSNQWTADALAAGGVKVGVFTPFEQGLMWRFPVPAGEKCIALSTQ